MKRHLTLALIVLSLLVVCLFRLTGSRAQSGSIRRITNTTEEGININPSLSGDGRVVGFESTEDVAAAGGGDQFRAIRANITSDPASFSQMAGSRAVAPAVSQDGSRIAFASKDDPLGTNADGNSEIFLFDGTKLIQVTTTSPASLANRTTDGNFQPSISDDGRFVAFSSNRNLTGQNSDGNFEVFVYDSVANSFVQMTNSSGIVGFTDAKISGDGFSVAYIRDNGTTASSVRDLLRQPRFGLGPITLAAANVPALAMTYGRAISDDGSRIVYSAQTATNTTQVFMFDGRGGGSIRQITSLGARVTEVPLDPTISGDGSRIAFAARRTVSGAGSNSDGGVELYLYDIPTSTFSKITNAPSSATAEVVSSLSDDGSVVAFNFPRVLSGAVTNSGTENNSEIYISGTPARPAFGSLTILNGASLGNEPATTKSVAPDSIAAARGGLLANSTQQPQRLSNGTFPTNVGGTTVTVNGRPAQIFFVSPAQVNFLVPPQTEIGTADIIVTNSEGFPSRGSIATTRSAPGVFTKTGDGTGEALALNSDTLQASPFDPSNGKLRLTVFATGARNATTLSVTMGGQSMTPELVLPSADMPGLDEIHVHVPAVLKGAGVVTVSAQGDGRDANPSNTRFTGGDILINEVLADPPGSAPTDLIGDANHDGVRSSSDDEFVELVNSTDHDIDISGYQLFTRSSTASSDTLRHTFAPGTIVNARTAGVVFGGGAPNPSDPVFGGALILKASTGGLSLSNTGGLVTLRDSTGTVANIFEYGGATGLSGGSNQSLTRSPDITGAFTGHAGASGANGRLFSPGTHLDGTPFTTIPLARIDLTPISPAVDAGAKQQFTARAFDTANQEVTGVIFVWQSSNTAVATIDQTGLATSSNAGTSQIAASGRGIQSAPDTLTVRAVQRVLTRVDLSPNPVTIPATGAQQFTAKGIDQFGNEITGFTFAWDSSNTNVATIDQNGLATGLSQGQSTIKATTQNVSGNAVLNVTAPTLVVNEVLADPPTGTDGDANHDGTRDSAQDEFVELVNSTNAPMDISGWTLRTHSTTSTTETVRHTFAASTNVPAGNAMVLFGGGTLDPANPLFGCSQVVKASTGGLSLTNTGLTILIRDGSGNLVTQFSYGGSTGLNGGNAQSLTRSPDITGDFVLHSTAPNAGGRKFSAGLKLDGTPFGNCPGHPASVTLSPTSTTINAGQSTQLTAQAFDQFGRAMIGVPITFASDNTSVATIDSTTPNPSTGVVTANVGSHNPGTAHITASANDGTTTANSNQATLTVNGPALSINDVSVLEGNSGTTTFTFTVTLSQPAGPNGVKFDIATQDGTATTANNDYFGRTLTNQTIPNGAQTYSFDVTVNGDTAVEPNETFFVNVTNVSGASIAKSQAIGTIVNDDSPTLSINDVTANECDSGTTTFTFMVTTPIAAGPGGITFDIATADGTATSASGDYLARSLIAQTIPAGQSSYTFNVTVNGDTLVEPNETFFVNISNVSGATVNDAQGQGTIINDDTPNLVISQIYPGGGLTGAAYANDFIELYNRGTSTIDFSITPYSAQFLSTTGSTWAKTDLTSGVIAPGRYFLIKETSGGSTGVALPAADATGNINLTSTTDGKVALLSGTTLLTTSCPGDDGTQPFNPTNVVDFVGYGGTAATANHCYEGSGPASFTLSNNTIADFRKAGGCVDTNDNASDFFVAQPNPRNSASAIGDCKPEITINDVAKNEGNAGTTAFTFTVSLAAASSQIVTVNYATADGTAVASSDYQAASGPLTFNPGDLTKTITVNVNGDTTNEPNETFFVNLSNAVNAVILDSQGQGTINNDDPQPSISINDVAVAEGDNGTTPATFTVSLSSASGFPVTVNYTTADNTANAGSDYQAASGTVTFNAGETSKQIIVLVNGDTDFEQNETFFVNLSSPVNATIADGQGVGTINNDDPLPPRPTLFINDTSVTEGDSGTTTANFTVTLSPASGNTVTVDYATANGTATAGSDFQSASNTLIFAPGETTKQIAVTINGDTLVEPDETFFVNLTNVTGGAGIGDNQGIGTIQNDDVANVVISQIYPGGGLSNAIYANDYIELFNRGTTTVDFSITPFSAQFLSVTGSTWAKTDLTTGTMTPGHYFLIKETSGGANGLALPNADATGTINLTSTTDGKVALVAGTILLNGNCPGDDGTQPFNPTNVVDFVGYGGTAATANHCYEGSGPSSFTLSNNTIADFRRAGGCIDTNDNAADFVTSSPFPRNSSSTNDCSGGATPSLSINDVAVTEGNSGTTTATFTVSLSAPAQGADVKFDIATADATATTANNDYVAKSLTNQIIPAGQTAYTFSVTVNGDTNVEPDETFFVNVSNVTGATVADAQGIGTIKNDDLPTLSVNDVAAAEGDAGTKTFTFTISLSAPAPSTVTFDIASADGTATTADNDYVARSLTGQTIAAGQQTYQFDVTVNGDTTVEANETFFVNVANVSGATIADGQGIGTIQNDDSPALSINDVSANEGDTGTTTFTFTVSLSQPAPAGGVTFDIATADGTATTAGNDYVARSLTSQTIPAGQSNYTFDVTVNGDTLVEPNETFLVNITNLTGAAVLDGQGVGTIQNDDVADLKISQVYGGGNNSGATYQNDFVELFNHGSTTVDFSITPYSVQYAGVGSNFGTSKTNLTSSSIAPGKYFLVQESGGTTNGLPLPAADATGTINLASTAGKVALVFGTTALSTSTCPGDDAVAPFNPSDSAIADLVGYGSTAATAGHCYEGSAPTSAPSNSSAAFRKAGGCTDTNDNAADFLIATPSPRNSISPTNNCAGGATPNLSINDVTVTEGNSGTTTATFMVTLSAPAQGTDVTFDIATQDNSATTANSDYVAKSATNQIIPAGQTNYTFSVTVNGDTNVEPDETFFVNVTNVVGANVIKGQGTGTIKNDDLPALSINDVSALEGDSGTKTFSFTVSLSAPAPAQVSFDIATQDNTATVADNDYAARSLTNQTIAAGQQTYQFDVTVNGDTTVEPNETFFVNITNVSGATIADGQGTGTIQNDDSPLLSVSDVAANEGSSGTSTFIFNVTLNQPAPAGGVTFDIATADATATTAGNDYVARGLTGQTIAAGQQTYQFGVTVNGDTLVEPNETFFVNVTNVTGATVLDGQGQGTIQNDDTAQLVISQIYPGGGLTGATYTNDYIELFNRGTTTVDFSITPYSIQFLSTSGSTWAKTDLTSGTMPPGRYFLVKETGGANGIALPTADATGNINITSTTPGKVALVSGTTLLTGNCPGDDGTQPFNPAGGTIADFVGYLGNAATANHCYEGTGPASFTSGSNTTADFRKSGGCVDTNDNAADFVVAAPNPRNSSSATNDCSTGFRPDITINDPSAVPEGNSGTKTIDFTVTLSAASAQTVTVNYATADGTATTANNDYVTTSGTLTFNPSETSKTISVTINGDTLNEPDETFFVNLSNATNASILDPQGIGTIANDDPTPSLSINDLPNIVEGNSGTSVVNFTVSLSAASGQTVTVNFATADGTATAPSDYTATSGTLIFNPGETQKLIPVTIKGDTVNEPDETFFVNLSGVSATATISDAQGVGTIKNDDSSANADMSVTKTASPSAVVIPGNNIAYTITVTDNGADPASNAQWSDSTPANTVFASLSTPPAGWTCITPAVNSAGTITCSVPSLAASAPATFTLTVKVNAGTTFGTAITNTAAVTSDTADNNSANNSASATVYAVDPNSADLAITKSDSPDPVGVGNDITYTMTLTNNGPIAASSLSVIDNLPAQVKFRSMATPPPGWTCITPAVDAVNGQISCTTPSMNANASVGFTVTVRVLTTVTDNTVISNTVTISSSTTDSVSSNNSATSQTTARTPQLVITQIYPGGGNSGATYTNDFIEIFNRGTTTVDFSLTNFSVQYESAGGASWSKTDLTTGTIVPGQYFLIQEFAPSSPAGVALPAPDATGTINLSASGAAKVALVSGTTLLSAACPGDDGTQPFNPSNSTIMDFVGYAGTAATSGHCYIGSGPAPFSTSTNPNARSTIRTTTATCAASSNNSTDFTNPTTAPTARNKQTALSPCP
ncbi:MAG TPA: Calx-beta domain-containing protein [Pyrinomonadaceae bacterium]|nr:Calx-beta domain-containing protein [Pyrinomonadaceae bacterium]